MLADGNLKVCGQQFFLQLPMTQWMGPMSLMDGVTHRHSNGILYPVSLPLDDADGPTNVVATKALFNDKVRVTWDSKGPGSKYTVRRRYLDSDVLIATTCQTQPRRLQHLRWRQEGSACRVQRLANTATPIYKRRALGYLFRSRQLFNRM